MAQTIIMIGGLGIDACREEVLNRLRSKSGEDVTWDWILPDPPSGYQIRPKYFNRLLEQFRTAEAIPPSGPLPTVVKLPCLHGKQANEVYRTCGDPVVAPPDLGTVDGLVDWLFSPEAGLIPPQHWMANASEAALVALLAKLVKNKSWSKDGHGHKWTKEADLLGQSPVMRPGFTEIATLARRLLEELEGRLFLSKGGNQGKTPKEWTINAYQLPSVKKAILSRSLAPLASQDCLGSVLHRIMSDEEQSYVLNEIVNQRVLAICKETDRPGYLESTEVDDDAE